MPDFHKVWHNFYIGIYKQILNNHEKAIHYMVYDTRDEHRIVWTDRYSSE